MNSVHEITSQIVHLALDALSERQQIIANNIANATTDSYAVKYSSFEEYMSSQTDLLKLGANQSHLESLVQDARNKYEQGEFVQTSKQATVELDTEIIKLSENVVKYQALLQALKGRGEILKMAVREGRQ